MRRCLLLLLLQIPSVALAISPRWLLDGVGSVEGPSVEVPLYRGIEGHGVPCVEAALGDHRTLARVDAISGPTRIGAELTARLGLPVRTVRLGDDLVRITTIPTVAIGAMTLRKVRARVVGGDDLVLGLGAIDELAIALVPSEGVVRLVRGEDGEQLLAAIGAPTPLHRQPARPFQEHGERRHGDGLSAAVDVTIGGLRDGHRLSLRTDVARSRLQADVLPRLGEVGAALRTELTTRLLGVELPATVALVDGGLVDADPRVVGVLGYDALYAVDLARHGDRLAVRAAPQVTWHDTAPWLVADADRRLEAWRAVHDSPVDTDRPERLTLAMATSTAAGDPGDPEATATHRQLASAYLAAGAAEAAVQRALQASRHAGDRCEAHLELGTLRLRTAGSLLTRDVVAELVRQPLEHAGTLYGSWRRLDPATRERVRRGRSVAADVLQIEQPDRCGEAWGTLMGAWLAVGEPERVRSLYDLHRDVHRSVPRMFGMALLDTAPRQAEAPLRAAIAAGGRHDVDLRLALARAQVASGRASAAEPWLRTLPWQATDHPLTAALYARPLGAPLPPLHSEPGVIAAHLAHAVAGGRVDADAVEAALTTAEQRWPGSPQLEAMRAVWLAIGGSPIPMQADRAHFADTWAAVAATAAITGDTAALDEALAELHARFPDIPVGDLGLRELVPAPSARR